MAKPNETRTDKRIYFTTLHSGLYGASFQPINQKTGEPWQAFRNIKGWDAYRLHSWETKEDSGVIIGNPPASTWGENGRWTSLSRGFSSEALALAAIENEKRKSKR